MKFSKYFIKVASLMVFGTFSTLSCSGGGGVRFTPFVFSSERPLDGFWKIERAIGPDGTNDIPNGHCVVRHIEFTNNESYEVYTLHESTSGPSCDSYNPNIACHSPVPDPNNCYSYMKDRTEGYQGGFDPYLGNSYYAAGNASKMNTAGLDKNFFLIDSNSMRNADKGGNPFPDGATQLVSYKHLYYFDENDSYNSAYILLDDLDRAEFPAGIHDHWQNILNAAQEGVDLHGNQDAQNFLDDQAAFRTHFKNNAPGIPVTHSPVHKFIRETSVFSGQ